MSSRVFFCNFIKIGSSVQAVDQEQTDRHPRSILSYLVILNDLIIKKAKETATFYIHFDSYKFQSINVLIQRESNVMNACFYYHADILGTLLYRNVIYSSFCRCPGIFFSGIDRFYTKNLIDMGGVTSFLIIVIAILMPDKTLIKRDTY